MLAITFASPCTASTPRRTARDGKREERVVARGRQEDRASNGQGLPNFSSALRRSRRCRTMRERGRECCAHSVWVHLVTCVRTFRTGRRSSPRPRSKRKATDWYLHQMLGTANFNVGPLLAFASGNLCYQIEHHLFSGLPSNRYAEIATRVRGCATTSTCPHHRGCWASTCRRYGPYKLALPDRCLTAAS